MKKIFVDIDRVAALRKDGWTQQAIADDLGVSQNTIGRRMKEAGLTTRKSLSYEEAFWIKVKKTKKCWIWHGSINRNGYGYYRGKTAHSVAYRLRRGIIPSDMEVCHTCDNRACVNPLHLFVGTRKDNMQDCISKGRQNKAVFARGEQQGNSKLTRKEVEHIRGLCAAGHTQTSVAEKFGVTQACISHIVRRKNWRHL